MTIYRLIQNTPFGPEEIERLVAAYQETLRALHFEERDDPVTQIVAKKVFEVVQTGIEDPAEISQLVIRQLGLP